MSWNDLPALDCTIFHCWNKLIKIMDPLRLEYAYIHSFHVSHKKIPRYNCPQIVNFSYWSIKIEQISSLIRPLNLEISCLKMQQKQNFCQKGVNRLLKGNNFIYLDIFVFVFKRSSSFYKCHLISCWRMGFQSQYS